MSQETGFEEPQLKLLRARIHSRHKNSVKYNLQIKYDSLISGAGGIKGWVCRCKVGLRTVGCCAHIASVIWYLGCWKSTEKFKAPASYLPDIFHDPVILESEDEDEDEDECKHEDD